MAALLDSAKAVMTMSESTASLDRDLLASALRDMIRRFQHMAKEAGYTDAVVRGCTEDVIELLNRVELSKEGLRA